MSFLKDAATKFNNANVRLYDSVFMPEAGVAKEMKKGSAMYADQMKQLNEYFDNNKNLDFMDTTMARGFKQMLMQKVQEDNNAINANAAISGGTAESQLAQKNVAQKGYADTISNMTQYGTSYKDNMYNSYFSKMLGLTGNMVNLNTGAAQQLVAGQQRMADNFQSIMENASGAAESAGKMALMG